MKFSTLFVLSFFFLTSSFALDNFRLNPNLPQNVEYLNKVTEKNTAKAEKKEQTRAPSSVEEQKDSESMNTDEDRAYRLKYEWQKRYPRDDK